MAFAAGNLVRYYDRPAVITALDGEKILLRLGNSEKKVRPKEVEFLHPGPVSAPPERGAEPVMTAAELTELLEGGEIPWSDFLEFYYGAFTPEAALSGWREVTAGAWFTGTPGGVVRARPEGERAELLAAAEKKAAAERERREFLDKVSAAMSGGAVPEWSDAEKRRFREVEAVAREEAEKSTLLRDLQVESAPDKAHELLLKLGLWDVAGLPWSRRLGVPDLPPAGEIPRRDDLADLRETFTAPAWAVDDAGSGDPDDALSWYDGHLFVHIADPMSALTPEDPVFREAAARGATSYRAGGIIPMLPPEAVERFALGLTESSPALTFEINITADGTAEPVRIFGSRLRVIRWNYEEAEEHFEEPEWREMREALERFRRKRESDGAVFIRWPEVKIALDDNLQVQIRPCPVTPARELVANAMLAAGAAAAEFFLREGLNVPFAKQDEPKYAVAGESLPDMFLRKRAMTAGVTDPRPGPHAGVGLPAYVRVTSPLRRFSDLLAHWQLHAYLRGVEPLDFDTVENLLAGSEPAAAAVAKLERYASEFYVCVYLSQHPEWQGTGTVVNYEFGVHTVCLPELGYNAKCRIPFNAPPGTEVRLKAVYSSPAFLQARFTAEKLPSAAE